MSKRSNTNSSAASNAYRVFVNHLATQPPTDVRLRSLKWPEEQLLHVRNHRVRIPYTNIRLGSNRRNPFYVQYPRVHPTNLNRIRNNHSFRTAVKSVNKFSRNRLPNSNPIRKNVHATQLHGEINALQKEINAMWNHENDQFNNLFRPNTNYIGFIPLFFQFLQLTKKVTANKTITNQQFINLATKLYRIYTSRLKRELGFNNGEINAHVHKMQKRMHHILKQQKKTSSL